MIQHSFNDGAGWSAWAPLGGAAMSAPAAVAAGASRIDVWARGTGSAIQHDVWQAATGWSGWSDTWRAGPRR